MVTRCAAVGVDIYADAVLNHMAAGKGTGTAGTPYGGRTYLNFTSDELHHNPGDLTSNCQVTDYKNKTNVQFCDLVSLPDLCTGMDQTGAFTLYLNSKIVKSTAEASTKLLIAPDSHDDECSVRGGSMSNKSFKNRYEPSHRLHGRAGHTWRVPDAPS